MLWYNRRGAFLRLGNGFRNAILLAFLKSRFHFFLDGIVAHFFCQIRHLLLQFFRAHVFQLAARLKHPDQQLHKDNAGIVCNAISYQSAHRGRSHCAKAGNKGKHCTGNNQAYNVCAGVGNKRRSQSLEQFLLHVDAKFDANPVIQRPYKTRIGNHGKRGSHARQHPSGNRSCGRARGMRAHQFE